MDTGWERRNKWGLMARWGVSEVRAMTVVLLGGELLPYCVNRGWGFCFLKSARFHVRSSVCLEPLNSTRRHRRAQRKPDTFQKQKPNRGPLIVWQFPGT
jgi:hypothetical protein